jgi:hypothetical protein
MASIMQGLPLHADSRLAVLHQLLQVHTLSFGHVHDPCASIRGLMMVQCLLGRHAGYHGNSCLCKPKKC